MIKPVRGKYNPDTGRAEFSITHFSTYAVGYNKVVFDDVEASAWYNDAITSRQQEILSGIGANRFAPDNEVKERFSHYGYECLRDRTG